jgi:hypothetical protein
MNRREHMTLINLNVPISWKDRLLRLSHERSILQMKPVTLSGLIRTALDKEYGFSQETVGGARSNSREKDEIGHSVANKSVRPHWEEKEDERNI